MIILFKAPSEYEDNFVNRLKLIKMQGYRCVFFGSSSAINRKLIIRRRGWGWCKRGEEKSYINHR